MVVQDMQEIQLQDAAYEEIDRLSDDYDWIDGPNIVRVNADSRVAQETRGALCYDVGTDPVESVILFHPRYKDAFSPIKDNSADEKDVKGVARHEAAHSLYDLHLENRGRLNDRSDDNRDITYAPTEAFANYEQDMVPWLRDQPYTGAVENLGEIPEFWELISSKDDGITPYSGHGYGRLAAQLIELSHLRHMPLHQAQDATRRTLINIASFEELESHTRVACHNLDIPYYGDVIRQEAEAMDGYARETSPLLVPLAASDPERALAKKMEGEDAVDYLLEQSKAALDQNPSMEEFFRAGARRSIVESLSEDLGTEYEQYSGLGQAVRDAGRRFV